MRTRADLERQAPPGCSLVDSTRDASGRIVATWECPDAADGPSHGMTTARFLEALSANDDRAGELPPELVAETHRRGPAWLHALVKKRVRFVPEKGEVFQSPATTLALGYGDCDDSARLLVAVARAAGFPARLVYFLDRGQPAHVAAAISAGSLPWGAGSTLSSAARGGLRWAEATIDARFGEDPFAACRRLGIRRPDLRGKPVLLSGSRTVSMGAMTLPANLGPNFPSVLSDLSASLGTDPLDVLKLLLSESSLTPSAKNARGFPAGQYAVGINQFAPVNWHFFAPLTAVEYAALTAEEQLPYVFAYFSALARAHGQSDISGRDLYWLNFLPATYVPDAPDSHVIVTSISGYYGPNSGLDHGKKGYISAGDLQLSLDAQSSSSLYQALAPLVGGGSTASPSAALIFLMAAGVGAALSRTNLIDQIFRW